MGFLPKLTIAQKLPLALIGTGLLICAGTGFISYFLSAQIMGDMTQQRLYSVAVERAEKVEDYLEGLATNILRLTTTDLGQKATVNFDINWSQTDNPGETIREAFITRNPHPVEERAKLDISSVQFNYNFNHNSMHPALRSEAQGRGYRDIIVINPGGNVIYSVAKHDELGTNLAEGGGPYADTGLGRAFRAALASQDPSQVFFADEVAYAPVGGGQARFIATPVSDRNGKFAGVIAVVLPDHGIDRAMSSRNGLGETGETFLVGPDLKLRSDSVFTEGNDTLVATFDAPEVRAALAGTPAQGTIHHRGTDMLATAVPVNVLGRDWALVSVMSTAEALAPIGTLRNLLLGLGITSLAGVALLGYLLSRSITGPITRLTHAMDALAQGDLDVEVAGTDGRDEVSRMARAVEVFRENAQRVHDLTEEDRAGSERRRVERAQMMSALQTSFGRVVDAAAAGNFAERVEADFPDPELNALAASVNHLVESVERGVTETGAVLGALAQTDLTRRVEGTHKGAFERLKTDTNAVADRLSEIVTQLRETSRALKSATGEILAGANDLSGRTTKQAATIEETSAAMEQLAATVQQNAKRAREATGVAAGVTRTAEEGGQVMLHATEAMERITTSSGKISNIIGLIDDIAFQTNLLALNASVEAARAGEAGRGFAVVAVEVRRLAQSAAKASAEVKALIEQSGAEVKGGSKLVAEAATKLNAMLEAARTSNILMEEIARDSQEQAASIEEVNAAVRTMDEMTQHNAALVEETNASLEQAEAQASELDRIVEVFTLHDAERAPEPAPVPSEAEPPRPAVRGLQDRVREAARSYLGGGNTAHDLDWTEF